MGMRGPGMWMPKQKDGKNWIVKFTFTFKGEGDKNNSRKFRIKADALEFIKFAKNHIENDERVIGSTFKLEKL